MTSRCTCGYDGDPLVFGECRTCYPKPTLVTSEALMFAEKAGIPWPEERPYEQTLDESDRRGD